jgi:hypothetical protein
MLSYRTKILHRALKMWYVTIKTLCLSEGWKDILLHVTITVGFAQYCNTSEPTGHCMHHLLSTNNAAFWILDSLMGYSALQSRWSRSTFQRYVLPPISRPMSGAISQKALVAILAAVRTWHFTIQHFLQDPFLWFSGSRGISVSIVSDYWLDDRGSIPAKAQDFYPSLCVQTSSEAHPASCTMGTDDPFPVGGGGVKRGRGVTLTTHIYPLPRTRMSRSYISSPPWCLHGE